MAGLKPSLTDRQIEQILRDRRSGLAYKIIAQRVGCTPDQAIHYWRTSKTYTPRTKSAQAALQRERKVRLKRQAAQMVALLQKERDAAVVVLKREIALAVQDAQTGRATPYKIGDLTW